MLDKPKKPDVDFLYHYSSTKKLEYLEPILRENELYFPTGKELNDPAESRIRLTPPSGSELIEYFDTYVSSIPGLSKQECEQIKHKMYDCYQQQGEEVVLQMISQLLYEGTTSNHRIYSLSKRYNNMGLWTNYADNHNGYCLEFKNKGLFSKAYEVAYTDEKMVFNPTKPDEARGYLFWVKTRDWSNEEEVRIVTPSSMKQPFQFASSLLNRLILGYDMCSSDKTQIIKWATGRVRVVRAHYNDLKLQLELKEV